MNVTYNDIESLPSNMNYLFPFTMEIEYCAMVLWTIIVHLMKPVSF